LGRTGILEADTSGFFTLSQQDEALEFFLENGVSQNPAT
jgi:hypothetical protein